MIAGIKPTSRKDCLPCEQVNEKEIVHDYS